MKLNFKVVGIVFIGKLIYAFTIADILRVNKAMMERKPIA